MRLIQRSLREEARAKSYFQRVCAWCLAPFTPAAVHQKFCSDKHNNIAKAVRRKARLRGASVGEPVSRWEIYERDGGFCGLCRQAVDRGLRWPHPGSASVDHVVPITRGGKDAANNLQLAHLGCNLRKQNKLPGEARKPAVRRRTEAAA